MAVLTLVGQAKLLHACHVHLEGALVGEQIASIARVLIEPVAVGCAAGGGCWSVVLIGCRCPFLACLSD